MKFSLTSLASLFLLILLINLLSDLSFAKKKEKLMSAIALGFLLGNRGGLSNSGPRLVSLPYQQNYQNSHHSAQPTHYPMNT